jgi:MFS family permease
VLLDIRPLREHPAFRRLWLGATASGFGSQIGIFAVTYHIWDRTHNAAMVGLIGLFIAVPMVSVALLGSAFLDHVDRRRLALLTTYGQIATTIGQAAVVLWSDNGVWPILGLVGVTSGLSALGSPARRTFIPVLLPPDRLAAGLALNQMSFQMALMLGPALAGLITATWGTAVCLLIDAVSFVASLVGIAGLPATGVAGTTGRPGAGAVWEGLRFTAGTPQVRGALLSDLTATLLAMPMAVFPAINQEKFGGSPESLGLLTSAVAVGGVVASAVSGIATRRDHPGRVLLACGAVWGASLALVGISDQLPVVLGLLAVAGGADTWAVVSRSTVIQAATPESHRGRVAALEHIVGVAGPHFGGLRAGLVAAGTSGAASLVIGGVACVAGIGLINACVPGLRRFTVTADRAPVDRP